MRHFRQVDAPERRCAVIEPLHGEAVQIDEIAIGDGEIVPPSLGHVIEFPIRFVEQPSTALSRC